MTIPNDLGKIISLYQAAYNKRYPKLKRPNKHDAAIEMLYVGKQGILDNITKWNIQYREYNQV